MEYLVDSERYGERLVELFEAPAHAGRPDGANREGHAASRPRNSRVVLYLRVVDGSVEAAGFEVLGCPHTIAGAELVCADLRDRRLDELAAYDAGFLDDALPLPAEKLDIRLLLEDAVRDAAAGGN